MRTVYTTEQERRLTQIRTTIATAIVVTVAFPAIFQPAIDWIWKSLCSSSIYTSSLWETILTIGSYAGCEAFYTSLVIKPDQKLTRHDTRSGRTHLYRNGTVLIRPYARRLRELVEYAGPLIVLDLIMVKKFIGVPPEVIMRSGGYIPGARDITGLLVRPDWKVPSLHHFTWNSPFQLVRALPTAAPSSRQITLCVISALFLYDFLFYIPHIAMHKVKILWQLHVPHHLHAEIHPQITNQLTITERMTLLTAANVSLHTVGAHPLTRTIFVPIFLYLLVENHCGLDLPYGYHRILPSGWAAGPKEHAEHHRHGKVNFQPYLTWADKLAGTHSDGEIH